MLLQESGVSKRAAACLVAWALIAGPGGAEPFAVIDGAGHILLGHAHPPADAVTGVDDLRSLWRGRAVGFDGPEPSGEPASWLEVSQAPFRLQVESPVVESGNLRSDWVFEVLEGARAEAEASLGQVFTGPLVVMLYTEPTYARLHDERFGFPTGGFFDGRLHVAVPPGDLDLLRSRLRHEFSHALYRERTGADLPFWLNEGRALRAQRGVGALANLDPEERASLRERSLDGRWIPLSRLQGGFVGFDRSRAATAYLESALAAEWFEARTTPSQRALFLRRVAEGVSANRALKESTGLSMTALDEELRRQLQAEALPGDDPSGD